MTPTRSEARIDTEPRVKLTYRLFARDSVEAYARLNFARELSRLLASCHWRDKITSNKDVKIPFDTVQTLETAPFNLTI